MDDYEIIDIHTHMARTTAEEEAYFLIPGRRTRDRYATPDRAIAYMDQYGISKMVFLTLIPRPASGN